MLLIFTHFVVAALIIIFAGSKLTKYADKISELTGWGRLFVGSLLVAGATSLPELTVDVRAIKENLPDLAVGDLLGSSLFNLLILALLDFSYPSVFRGTTFSPKFLHHSLSAVLTIVLTSLVGVGIASRLEYSFLGVGLFSWAVLFIYLFGLRLIFIDGNSGLLEKEAPTPPISNKYSLLTAFLGYAASALVILIAAPYLVEAGDKIAISTGFGHTFIGTVLIAFTTSLPELIATLSAFQMGKPDLALGNIFGSNAFNMVLFVPLDFLFSNSLLSAVSRSHVVTAFGVVTATGIAVMGQLYRKKERSRLTEPTSETVLVVILLFLLLLYSMNA
ncbi:MAG: inner membrane protein YrbG [Pseudomonadota bacterium]|jgi:cation:H+ antiporter